MTPGGHRLFLQASALFAALSAWEAEGLKQTQLQHHLLPRAVAVDSGLQKCFPTSLKLATPPALTDCLGLYFIHSCLQNTVPLVRQVKLLVRAVGCT